MKKIKQIIREWIYGILFSLLSTNKVKRDSFVLGLIIGYINPQTTRTMLQQLLSDVSKTKIDESIAANGVLLSSFLLPREGHTVHLEDINPDDNKMCSILNKSILCRCMSMCSNIDIDSVMMSTKLILKKKNILSNIA